MKGHKNVNMSVLKIQQQNSKALEIRVNKLTPRYEIVFDVAINCYSV